MWILKELIKKEKISFFRKFWEMSNLILDDINRIGEHPTDDPGKSTGTNNSHRALRHTIVFQPSQNGNIGKEVDTVARVFTLFEDFFQKQNNKILKTIN